jgi:oligosaccharide reducing-end xylanase
MMITVQMNKKTEFDVDALWNWAKTNMQHSGTSEWSYYFAWNCNITCNTTGAKLSKSPAADGEEYFVTALFFVAHRWGNGSGIYNHDSEAKVNGVTNMFD